MPTLETLPFDNAFARLPDAFYTRLPPTPLPEPYLVAASPAAPDALRLTFPPDGAEIDTTGPLTAKARGGRGPWTFLLNGTPVAIAMPQPVASLPNPGAGFARLTVVDANGASATAAIRLH